MAVLTPTEIDALIAKLKRFPYLVSVGSTSLGPLSGPPSVTPEVQTQDVTLYETEADVQARFITVNDLMVTVTTRDVGTAMTLLGAFAKGDDVLASAKKVVLTMVPITSATEPTITFSNA